MTVVVVVLIEKERFVNRRFLYTHDPRSLDYVRCVDSNFVLKVHVVGQEKRPLQKH